MPRTQFPKSLIAGVTMNEPDPQTVLVPGVGVTTRSTPATATYRQLTYNVLRCDHVHADPGIRTRKVMVPRTRLTAIASDQLPVVLDFQILKQPPCPE